MKPSNNCALSIITINRNNELGLKKTIQSVLTQSNVNNQIEYVIIDGNSTDNSVDVIKRELYSSTALFPIAWISEPDTGIYNAMNKGIKKASGDYCLFLNSGDTLISNDIISVLLDNIQSDEDFYFSDYYFNKNGTNKLVSLPDKLNVSYFLTNTINHQNTLIKRNLFSKIGLYDESYKLLADWDFYIKAHLKYNCSFEKISHIISNYDSSGISSTAVHTNLYNTERKMLIEKNFNKDTNIINYYINLEEEYKKSIWFEIKTKWGISSFLLFCMKTYRFFIRRIRRK